MGITRRNMTSSSSQMKRPSTVASSLKIPTIVNYLKEGESIAIVSDAGMPGICDPGEDIAKSVRSHGIDIICIPGVIY